MAKTTYVIAEKTDLEQVADSIREKTGGTEKLSFPNGFSEAINSIPTDSAEVYYIDLDGNYPNYTCSVAMDDIKAAYNSGYNIVCRCALGSYTATLPLFIPMPAANTWIFSGSGALAEMSFPAQSLTIAINNGTVLADNTRLASTDDIPTALKNPQALTFTSAVNGRYGGSTPMTVNIPQGETGVVSASVPLTYNSSSKELSISAATADNAGTMSAADKAKLDGVENGANAYSLPIATATTLGGVKVGSGLTIKDGVLTLDDEVTVTTQNANLLDKSDTANQVSGKIFYVGSSTVSFINVGSDTAIYFPVGKWGAGTYKFPIDYTQYGGDAAYKTALFNADKGYIKTKTSSAVDTSDAAAYILSLDVTQDEIDSGTYYIGLSIRTTQLGTSAMVVKNVDYPESYIEYGTTTTTHKLQKLENELSGKKVSFCGDSICAGTSVGDASPIYGKGWAGIIGEKNGMTWQNLGVNGATIAATSSSTGTLIVVNQLAKAYSDADYIILEGGCNDFDQMEGKTDTTTMGEMTAVWDDSYKQTTFAGALEHLFYTAVTKHPKAKIGYIIPPIMGRRNWTQYETISYRVYYNLAINICKKWGIPYIDLWYESPLNPNLSVYYDPALGSDGNISDGSKCYVDGQHLTEAGYNLIAPKIEAWMRTL